MCTPRQVTIITSAARAQRTAITPSNNVISKPPTITLRQRPRSQKKTGSTQQMAALSTITPCTHCGRPVASAALITFHNSSSAATLPSPTNGTSVVMGFTQGITRLNLGQGDNRGCHMLHNRPLPSSNRSDRVKTCVLCKLCCFGPIPLGACHTAGQLSHRVGVVSLTWRVVLVPDY